METIGSAERHVDKHVIRDRFNIVMDGSYCNKLYELFEQERTQAELG